MTVGQAGRHKVSILSLIKKSISSHTGGIEHEQQHDLLGRFQQLHDILNFDLALHSTHLHAQKKQICLRCPSWPPIFDLDLLAPFLTVVSVCLPTVLIPAVLVLVLVRVACSSSAIFSISAAKSRKLRRSATVDTPVLILI